MSENSKIEWTDATWNPITGCSVTSPGCKNCYAMKLAGTRLRNHPSRAGLTQESNAGPVWTGDVRFNEQWLTQPMHWTRPRMIFVCAHGDLFHEAVPDEWIDKVFAVMARARHHTFQVLTKRTKRMREYFADPHRHGRVLAASLDVDMCGMEWCAWPLPNVWIGASAEDQRRLDERIEDLLCTPAALHYLSLEPLLGPIDLERPMPGPDLDQGGGAKICQPWMIQSGIDWVIVGGESGREARPMSIQWARSLRDQCQRASVPFFFKQWGEWAPAGARGTGDRGRFAFGDYRFEPSKFVQCDGYPRQFAMFGARCVLERVGKKAAGRHLDGRTHDEFPQP